MGFHYRILSSAGRFRRAEAGSDYLLLRFDFLDDGLGAVL
jgi:hypothetical protein